MLVYGPPKVAILDYKMNRGVLPVTDKCINFPTYLSPIAVNINFHSLEKELRKRFQLRFLY